MQYVLINDANRADYQERLVHYYTHVMPLPEVVKMPVRIRQVAIACLDDQDIVGVATILKVHVQDLDLPMWFYRTSVAEDYRQRDIARTLANTLYDHMDASYQPGDPLGFYYLVESATLIDNNKEVIWPRMGAFYMGRDAKGREKRVKYFTQASLAHLS